MIIALNLDNVLESLGGDPDLLRDVLGILMEELPRHMASLGQAIANGDAEAVEHLAHSIKGELGYLSLPEVSRNAAELEASGQRRILPTPQTSTEDSKPAFPRCCLNAQSGSLPTPPRPIRNGN